ncbi:DUF6093 family protein [Streptomyces flaveus]|uniref:Uncharacterized protein n=1 Tax=Streptomyces flaveus TaxID=66370 RepID=A0A917RF59_9ACTN|nr:DUF6093 family protein [Streptomyces flaveus]GGL03344.1 hypothetical protein GCM10010094_75230 [Streptomyces flaveus]
MALDLSGVRRVVERLLDDRLELWRDVDGVSGDVLDEGTGELKLGGSVPVLLWAGVGAIVRPGSLGVVPHLDSLAAAGPSSTAYQALLPLTAPSAAVDDVLVVSRTARDPQLTGRRFRVVDVGLGTYTVVRVMRLELLAD